MEAAHSTIGPDFRQVEDTPLIVAGEQQNSLARKVSECCSDHLRKYKIRECVKISTLGSGTFFLLGFIGFVVTSIVYGQGNEDYTMANVSLLTMVIAGCLFCCCCSCVKILGVDECGHSYHLIHTVEAGDTL